MSLWLCVGGAASSLVCVSICVCARESACVYVSSCSCKVNCLFHIFMLYFKSRASICCVAGAFAVSVWRGGGIDLLSKNPNRFFPNM